MEAYIYNADIYCADCTAQIKADLDRDGQKPANVKDECSYDSDQYPKGPYDDGGGEADCPQHCARCHVFLDNPLTTDGVKYVIEQFTDFILNGGAAGTDVMTTWADHVSDYCLDDSQRVVLEAMRMRISQIEEGKRRVVVDKSDLAQCVFSFKMARGSEVAAECVHEFACVVIDAANVALKRIGHAGGGKLERFLFPSTRRQQ